MSESHFIGSSKSDSSSGWNIIPRWPVTLVATLVLRLQRPIDCLPPIPSNDGPWKKRSGKSLQERESDANFSHETVSPSASTERCQPPPPDRAAERGAAPQTDPHRCPRWLWENHSGQ